MTTKDMESVEESPTMRSLWMQPSSSLSSSIAPTPGTIQAKWPPPPASVLATRTDLKHGIRDGKKPFMAAELPSLSTTCNVSSVPNDAWNVCAAVPLPLDYILSRTHVSVRNASSLEISKQISNCLFDQSITATFDNQMAVAKAETSDCLRFEIRLWASMEQVIVEVQRTAGCGFAFRQISKKVLQAAQQNGSNVSTRTGGTVVHPESVASITRQTIPSSIPKASPAEWEACTMDQLERVACALRPTGNRRDGHPLALKSLMQMTKTAQCRQVCAQQVLYKNGELQSTIVSLIQTGRLCSAEREDSEERNGPGKDYFELMHRYALCVLANCLQCWSESQGPMSVNADNVSILSNDSTVLALVQDITAVATKPHDAAVACRCLLYLCRHSTRVKQGLRARFDAVVHLDAARQSLHAIVEEPARLLLQALQD